MSSFVSVNVAAEKVDAVKRFERKRMFLKFLPAIEGFEALVAVLLLLSWLTPSVSAVEFLRRIVSGDVSSGIFIFVVVNVLIALIFSLSNHHQKLIEPDLYFQYVSSAAAPVSSFSSAVAPPDDCSSSVIVSKTLVSYKEEKTSERRSGIDLISVTLENTDTTLTAEETRPTRREMARTVSSVADTAHATRRKREMMPPTTTGRQVYRRSISEKHDVRGDFGRSMRRLCDIDELSSDEFRSTVETFIAGKKKMLLKEWMKP